MTKKPYTLDQASLEEALAQVPEKDREEVRKLITSAFAPENLDADGKPKGAKRMVELPAGTTHCPDCGMLLERFRSFGAHDGKEVWDCPRCDVGFVLPAVDA